MKSIWICFAFLWYFSYCCGAGRIIKRSKAQDNSNEFTDVSDYDEVVEETTLDYQGNRKEEELDKLYGLAKESIRNKVNANTNIVDIIRRLIDANATGILHSYPSSCPLFASAHGIYIVNVTNFQPFPVYCDTVLAGAGWTVIQRRIDGNLNFYRNWTTYKNGFGNLSSEFFIGLDKLHAITSIRPHELYIYLEGFDGVKRFALYDDFFVGSEQEFYKLNRLGKYSGDAGDSFKEIGRSFSTFDIDNDQMSNHICAEELMGGWWYGGESFCAYSSLNGLYLNANVTSGLSEKGIYWHNWRGQQYSYKTVQMMIRPKCPCSYSN